jgi:hypothetical protein
LFINATGQVGIGGTPGVDLEITSTLPIARLRDTTDNSYGEILNNNGALSIRADEGNVASSSYIDIRVDGSERARIDSSGRLGLGTSSPAHSLHVAGDFLAINRSYFTATTAEDFGGLTAQLTVRRGADAAGSAIVGHHATLTSGRSILALFSNNGGTDTKQFEVLTQGNVYVRGSLGIGNTSPTVELDVASADECRIRARATTNGVDTRLSSLGLTGNAGIVGTYSNHPFVIFANSSERARIDSSGRLLVGTSTSVTNGQGDARLQVTSNSSNYYAADFGHFSNDAFAGAVYFKKTRSTTAGGFASVVDGDVLGDIRFAGADGTTYIRAALIECEVDGTPGTNDMPGRLVFSTTSDNAAFPTERLRITSAGVLQVADAGNIAVGTTTGTKIGTATTQKLGFYNATPVVQPTAVADATDAATVITQLNALLSRMRTLGLIAT